MSGENRRRCALCERHQRMETMDGMAFWIEWGEDDRPRLCMDTRAQGGGLNVLCVQFCPICGRECENFTEQEEKHGETEEKTGVFHREYGPAGPDEVSAR